MERIVEFDEDGGLVDAEMEENIWCPLSTRVDDASFCDRYCAYFHISETTVAGRKVAGVFCKDWFIGQLKKPC